MSRILGKQMMSKEGIHGLLGKAALAESKNQNEYFFSSFDQMEAKIRSDYRKIVSPPVEESKVQVKQASKADIGGGGGFVSMQKDSYDIVLNVLLGIRRGLADLSNVIPLKLDQH